MPNDPMEGLGSASTNSSPSIGSASRGVKRQSEADSPLGSRAKKELIVGSGTLSEPEWQRCCPLYRPPYPLALVGRVSTMVAKFTDYILETFVHRIREKVADVEKSRFRRKNVPAIALKDYMTRICNYVVALEPVMLLAVLQYAHLVDPPVLEEKEDEKTDENETLLVLDVYTIHRFVMTSLCVASKALGDHYYSNSFYAKVGGISTSELNALELELVMLLDWRLQLSHPQLEKYWHLLDCAE